MLSLPATTRVFLHREPVDFRKSHDGLCGVIRSGLSLDPLSGDLFVFLNKRRNRVKLLQFDGNGLWLHYKRLEKGTFRPLRSANADGVTLFISGNDGVIRLDLVPEGAEVQLKPIERGDFNGVATQLHPRTIIGGEPNQTLRLSIQEQQSVVQINAIDALNREPTRITSHALLWRPEGAAADAFRVFRGASFEYTSQGVRFMNLPGGDWEIFLADSLERFGRSSLSVSVEEVGIRDVDCIVYPKRTLSGRVSADFDESALKYLRVTLVEMPFWSGAPRLEAKTKMIQNKWSRRRTVKVSPDGHFLVNGLHSGDYFLQVSYPAGFTSELVVVSIYESDVRGVEVACFQESVFDPDGIQHGVVAQLIAESDGRSERLRLEIVQSGQVVHEWDHSELEDLDLLSRKAIPIEPGETAVRLLIQQEDPAPSDKAAIVWSEEMEVLKAIRWAPFAADAR